MASSMKKQLFISTLIAGAALLVVLLFFVQAFSDPLISYYGSTLRRSALETQTDHSLYCQQLASFSFGASFACFDSKLELDYFAANPLR